MLRHAPPQISATFFWYSAPTLFLARFPAVETCDDWTDPLGSSIAADLDEWPLMRNPLLLKNVIKGRKPASGSAIEHATCGSAKSSDPATRSHLTSVQLWVVGGHAP
jgi:hypothetical protein